MNTADTIMVGPLGAIPLAAAGLGSAIHFFGLVICTGVIVGMSPLVSQAFGAGDLDRTRRVLVQGTWLALVLSVPIAVMNLLGEPIALALGQDPEVAALTGGYMRALSWGVTPYFVFMAGRQYLEGLGSVRPPMVITFFALAVNIVANWILIYGVEGWIPALGVVGSGIATSIVRWGMCLAMIACIAVHPSRRRARAPGLRPDRPLLAGILRVGTPIGAQYGLEVGLFSFAAVMMGWLGSLELAAHQVTINIASATFMVALGVSLAGSIRVGQHIGAHRPRAMRRAAISTYVLAGGFMGLCALGFILMPEGLIRLYTSDPEIVDLGARLLLFAAAFQIFDASQVAGISVLRGAADTRKPMLLAGIGYWGVGLPVAWILAFPIGMGATGIWTGLSFGLAATAILLFFRVRQTFWRTPISALRAG